ncbi:MAG: allantoate amidohydrolase [Candidatus Acidiferrum sp.]
MPGLDNATAHANKIVSRCKLLASFSEDPAAIRRMFLCPAMRDCHREISRWLNAAGAKVSVDAAGNLRGSYAGAEAGAPRLLIGSHLDTIPNAGAYDGVLGVVLAVALLESLEARQLPFAIEIIGFSEEEGVRFGAPFIGSRALVGGLDEELLSRRDETGISVRAAIESFGLNPTEIPHAALKDETLAYLEFHIEQGPVLDSLGRSLGVVEAIAAQTRAEFVFTGHANHAGTTPMHLRHDAVAGAAEWIVAVEHTARNTAGLVATVGQIEAEPGAINVIAGSARVTLDVRHGTDEICEHAAETLIRQAEAIANKRGLSLKQNVLLKQRAVKMDAFLVGQIDQAIRQIGCDPHRMVSGAGHDAMILAEKVPAAMIFLRSPGGISHDPAESLKVEDVANALECGLQLLDQLAKSSEFQKRMCRA